MYQLAAPTRLLTTVGKPREFRGLTRNAKEAL
jgi:hypothetical protein